MCAVTCVCGTACGGRAGRVGCEQEAGSSPQSRPAVVLWRGAAALPVCWREACASAGTVTARLSPVRGSGSASPLKHVMFMLLVCVGLRQWFGFLCPCIKLPAHG